MRIFPSDIKTNGARPINFDGEQSRSRARILPDQRPAIGSSEYHLDGLRIDATQAFHDRSESPILPRIGPRRTARRPASASDRRRRKRTATDRTCSARPRKEAASSTHWRTTISITAAMVRLTGRREAYYRRPRRHGRGIHRLRKWGYLFQGQRYAWQNNPRGTAAFDIAADRFINFLQNHDQLANSPTGLRLHELTSRGRFRAMTALFLLMPQTPMLFQGQEFAASSPFFYFNDCGAGEAKEVAAGRAKFLSQFRSYALPEIQSRLPDPCDPDVFQRCKLDFGDRRRHKQIYDLHRDLLQLRRDDPVLRQHDATHIHGTTLGCDAFLLRYLPPDSGTRLIIVNFGAELRRESISQSAHGPAKQLAMEHLVVERRSTIRRHRNRRRSTHLRAGASRAKPPCVTSPGERQPKYLRNKHSHETACHSSNSLVAGRTPHVRSNCSDANGSSPTAWVATLPARYRELPRAAITDCWWPRCNRRSAA